MASRWILIWLWPDRSSFSVAKSNIFLSMFAYDSTGSTISTAKTRQRTAYYQTWGGSTYLGTQLCGRGSADLWRVWTCSPGQTFVSPEWPYPPWALGIWHIPQSSCWAGRFCLWWLQVLGLLGGVNSFINTKWWILKIIKKMWRPI